MADEATCSKFACFDVEEDSDDEHESGEIDDTEDVETLPEQKSDAKDKNKKRKNSEDLEEESVKRMCIKSVNDDDSDIEVLTNDKDIIKEVTMEAMKNRVVVTTVETLEACTHEIANPPNCPYEPLTVPTNQKPAKTYPFILDPFQKEAILCIDNNQSVLVSAHTSAGKTVVAEYAIAKSLQNNQRVIYTTPIKALSNQKYREFSEEFKDVGLITGDVTINPEASCLIMTTEILRSMLYRGSEVTREVGWVIFDEIHYMRDKERGVVWEETIILLPHNVHFVFLSATIPNARQFAEWVCTLHNQPCHVVYTDYRPTPLQHFIYPAGGDGIHLVVDEKRIFRENNFNAAMSVLHNAGDNAKIDRERGRRGGMKRDPGNTNVYQVVKMVMERNFAPVIVFSFSKKDCEAYAKQMVKLDFNSVEEKRLVDEVFDNAMDVLKPEDKKMPQIENVLPFLRRGIGIHHGGLLPILKETIEILFSEGLIKALFATETFAMGLNMPARTVVFTSMRKFDGKEYRWISSGEYIQMSGRAGRRGLDDKGIVIAMVDEKVTPAVCKNIVQGLPDPINSAFQLTYTMVLNLLRVDDINPEYMMERSFFQFQSQSTIPNLFQKYEDIRKECNSIVVPSYEEMKLYHELKKSIDKYKAKCRKYIFKPVYILPFLKSGRMVRVQYANVDFDWGILVNFKKSKPKKQYKGDSNSGDKELNVTLDVLLHVDDKEATDNCLFSPCPKDKAGVMEVVTVNIKDILDVSSVRVHLPDDLRPLESRLGVLKILIQVKQRFQDQIPLLDPINDIKIDDSKFLKLHQDLEKLKERLPLLPIAQHPDIDTIYETMLKKIEKRKAMRTARANLSTASSILQLEELKNRKKVLRRLQFCDDSDIIQIKGRVACELSGADELLLTEMIFNGLFDKLTPQSTAALLSCLVCDEKNAKNGVNAENLSSALRSMQHIARNIARVSTECSINLLEDDYVDKFKPSLVDVVYAWCNGATFLQLCQMTDIYEGSIIRTMRRLEELLRQLCQASRNIGNNDLEKNFLIVFS